MPRSDGFPGPQGSRSSPLRGQQVVVRPAPVDDAETLVRWHGDPEVARFWGGRSCSREGMITRLTRPEVDAYVIEVDGVPVGYLQAWFGEGADCGLDMFLIPAARGCGLGPDAGRTPARYLLDEGGRGRVTIDFSTWNDRSIRGWQRAGFRPVEEREPDGEHVDRWLLMAFEPQSA